MPWKAVAGSTFCFRASPEDIEHLYFVLNDPMDFVGYPTQSCIFVNASTPRKGHDPTCMIPAGCHAFIDRESFIYYRYARIERAASLERNIGPPPIGWHREMDAVPMNLVKFILSNMIKSPRTARELKPLAELAFDKLMGL